MGIDFMKVLYYFKIQNIHSYTREKKKEKNFSPTVHAGKTILIKIHDIQ